MASQSAAAHIMKPVVSMSMSPESFSSGVMGADVALSWGAVVAKCGLPSIDFRLPSSWLAYTSSIRCGLPIDYGIEFSLIRIDFPRSAVHVDGQSRRFHLVRRQA